MSGRYAEKTRVPVTQSRDELQRTLARYGADQFMYGGSGRAPGCRLPRPRPLRPVRHRPARERAAPPAALNIMLPNGATVGDWAEPEIARIYATGEMPSGLLALPEKATG